MPNDAARTLWAAEAAEVTNDNDAGAAVTVM